MMDDIKPTRYFKMKFNLSLFLLTFPPNGVSIESLIHRENIKFIETKEYFD